MGHHAGKQILISDLDTHANTAICREVHPNENSIILGEAGSSSSSTSTRVEDLESDGMIAQLLSEELSAADSQVGRRLSHLSSIPHHPRINQNIPTANDANVDHQRLLDRLYLYGLQEFQMIGDGNCQFRALSHQLYQTSEYHKFVRKQIVRHLKTHQGLYEGYIPMKYSSYLKNMRRSGEWGDHVTLQAAADCFGVRICLITSFRENCFIEIMPKQAKSKQDLFLSFWSEIHYNSIYAAPAASAHVVVRQKKKHWLF